MKKATERQLAKLKELEIEFMGELYMDEAAAMLRDHLKPVAKIKKVKAEALVVVSELGTGEFNATK
jgi:hypothetical protein